MPLSRGGHAGRGAALSMLLIPPNNDGLQLAEIAFRSQYFLGHVHGAIAAGWLIHSYQRLSNDESRRHQIVAGQKKESGVCPARPAWRAGIVVQSSVSWRKFMSTVERIMKQVALLSDEDREKVLRYVIQISGQPEMPAESGKHFEKVIPEGRKVSDGN